ncbi:hypothetical protein [Rhodopirellula sp. MGV]|uniref:hypothetical protein n=1 Tax=Rhodopirellula sp. MGV TaxID=2023130 RepID=UPI000B97B98C|nr:hypothetical protein [Rhodopirellula sp. MGV]OYP34326.1 hypothetical protein CGZ80_14775 [Rhodopirellula sp. MGV]PNY35273.1 hypothetical protein C2E31_19215 [Rhodopirellula baltica]
MSELRTYNDWLTLPEDSREHFHRQWNVYAHEMFWVPMCAASRLAAQTSVPVVDLYAGVWHGGEYVLHLTVSRESLSSLPRPLEQTFEGFRVIWLGDINDVESQDGFIGKWFSSGDFGSFEISVSIGTEGLRVECTDTVNGETHHVMSPSVHLNQLSFTSRSGDRSLFHTLDLDTGEKFNHRITRCQIARHIRDGA